MKDLIMRAVYEFYDEKIAPTLDMIYEKILQKTSGEDYEFPYGRSTLSKILKSLGFHYCRNKNRQVLMESPRIQAMRYEFLRKLRKFRSDGYKIVYLDETRYDTHDTPSRILPMVRIDAAFGDQFQKVKGL